MRVYGMKKMDVGNVLSPRTKLVQTSFFLLFLALISKSAYAVDAPGKTIPPAGKAEKIVSPALEAESPAAVKTEPMAPVKKEKAGSALLTKSPVPEKAGQAGTSSAKTEKAGSAIEKSPVPVKTEQAKTAPAKTVPVKTAPAKTEPVGSVALKDTKKGGTSAPTEAVASDLKMVSDSQKPASATKTVVPDQKDAVAPSAVAEAKAPTADSKTTSPAMMKSAPIPTVVIPATPAGASPDDKKVGGAENLPSGKELVNMDFPEPTEIKDIIKAIALWTGKNVILDRNVSGKVQIISPKKVTKEEAYQAFLSALNLLKLTTVETGKVIKIMKISTAAKDNLKTFTGSGWAPRTDEIITQIIPLKYVDAKQIQGTLTKLVSSSSLFVYEPTNTLIVSDSGFKVRRILEILELLDVQTQQPKILIIPIKYSDAKGIYDKLNEILKTALQNKRGGANSFKIMSDEKSNSIIAFGPPRTVDDIRDLIKTFDVPLDDPASQSTIHVRPLDYADAKKLATTLSALTSGGKNAAGFRRPPVKAAGPAAGGDVAVSDLGDGLKITSDDSSNSLLITGSRTAYDALNSIIRKLDMRRSQVYIEADILDLNQENGFNFKSSFLGGSANKDGSGSKVITGWQAGTVAGVTASGAASAAGAAAAFGSDMSIGILSGASFKVPGLGDISPGAVINILKNDGNTRVLSSPHILTSNNEEAVISVGEKIYFKQGSTVVNGVAEDKYGNETVELTFTVKPNLSTSGYITMMINVEANSISGTAGNGTPNISKRKSKQIVTVKDGQTVVISGLIQTSSTDSFKKIPLLGDIPIVGWLFRNTEKKDTMKNLAMFLTPREVNGAADLAAIYKEKIAERDQYLTTMYGSDVKDSDFYKKLPSDQSGTYRPTKLDELEEKRLDQDRKDFLKVRGYESDPEKKDSAESKTEEALQEVGHAEKASREREVTLPIPVSPDLGGSGGGSSAPVNVPEAPAPEPAFEAPADDNNP
ncbi:MAG: type II secretion system secretin GspD [Oligoflexales bacterium]|nr:type II secretion system secretin GspD [Oligoflexales bacterium]